MARHLRDLVTYIEGGTIEETIDDTAVLIQNATTYTYDFEVSNLGIQELTAPSGVVIDNDPSGLFSIETPLATSIPETDPPAEPPKVFSIGFTPPYLPAV